MSARDKKILVYLGAIVIMAAAYFLGMRPLLDKIEVQTTTNENLRNELRQKTEAKENAPVFEQEMKNFADEFNSIVAEFPSGILDEKSLLFVADSEVELPIWFYEVKFAVESEDMKAAINGTAEGDQTNAAGASVDEQAQIDAAEAAENGEAAPQGTEGEQQAAPEAAAGNKTATSLEGMYGLDYELGLAYRADYLTLKQFLDYINKYPERLVIKNMDARYDSDTQKLEGTITLSQYAITSPDRPMTKVPDTTTALGTFNLFDSSNIPEVDTSIAQEVGNSDYFIKLNGVTDNATGKTIGRANDVAQESYITSNKNDKEDVNFTVTGSEGKYKAEYAVGKNSFFDVEFEKLEGEDIVLRVISSERMDDSDEVAINLNLKNDSDRRLKVVIVNEDIDNPRVNISEQSGDIEINQ